MGIYIFLELGEIPCERAGVPSANDAPHPREEEGLIQTEPSLVSPTLQPVGHRGPRALPNLAHMQRGNLIGGSLKRRARWRCRSCRGREETTDGQINRHPRGRGAPGGSLLLRGGGGGGSPSAAPVTCRIWHGRRARESPPSGSCGGRLRGQRRRGRNSDRSAASGATRCGAATAAAVKPSSAPGKRLQKEVQQL